MIYEDTKFRQLIDIFRDMTDTIQYGLIVIFGRLEKLYAALLQSAHRCDDVVGIQGDMLDTGAAIEIKKLFNLGFASSLSGLVDGELDTPAAVLHHFGHEGRVFRTDGTIIEVYQLCKAQDPLVKFNPFIHFAQLDVAHHMIDGR